MATILQMAYWKALSWKKVFIFDLNFTEVWSLFLSINKAAVVQVVAWHLSGDKPVPEPVVNKMSNISENIEKFGNFQIDFQVAGCFKCNV